MNTQSDNVYGTFDAALARSKQLEENLKTSPERFRVLTGDRPTGNLHIGHLFGSLQNRVRLQNMGVETFIVIADYQVLTDRNTFDKIAETIHELVIDYLAVGIDPENKKTHIFPHSYIPELNQLLLPFLTLVSNAELNRNPTVKEEITASGMSTLNAGIYTYPIHQAADILFCKGNVVPVGKDQLPHLEICRTIARRFNKKFSKKRRVFPEPAALLSEAPLILGLDGEQKMSKSRNNAIMLSSSDDETAKLIKRAKTDAEKCITYDSDNRPEVANLLRIAALSTGRNPSEIAEEIGVKGAGALKKYVTESLNECLKPIRQKRQELEKNPEYIKTVLKNGINKAREEAEKTLEEVRKVMNMSIF
jgi:tryptophanyl-tRNA synthetase